MLKKLLALLRNCSVEYIPSGCCGMAGTFGYERKHYDISNTIAEQILFPYIRRQNPDTIIIATGISCRHQILDGMNKKVYHIAEILFDNLTENKQYSF